MRLVKQPTVAEDPNSYGSLIKEKIKIKIDGEGEAQGGEVEADLIYHRKYL